MKTTTNHNNSDQKPGSTVAPPQHQGVTRNIRGDMFRRLFFGSFLFAEKEMNKKMRDALTQNYLTQLKKEKIMKTTTNHNNPLRGTHP